MKALGAVATTCEMDGCDGALYARALCVMHYNRWLRGTLAHEAHARQLHRQASYVQSSIRKKRRRRGQPMPVFDLNRLQALCDAPCVYCGARPAGGVDHRLPIAQGGSDAWENLDPCCFTCNRRKHNRTPAQWALAQAQRSEACLVR